MGPVEHAPLLVPFVLAQDLDSISLGQGNPLGEVDVMGHEERMARGELDHETLMARTLQVVREEAGDLPFDFDHDAFGSFGEKGSDRILRRGSVSIPLEHGDRDRHDEEKGEGDGLTSFHRFNDR